MKKILVLLIMLAFVVQFSNCKKKENPPEDLTSQGSFTFNSISYNTPSSYFVYASNYCAIAFVSNSIHFDTIEQEWKGIGNFVDFNEILGSSPSGLQTGTFTENFQPQVGNYSTAGIHLNYNFEVDTGYYNHSINGSITIQKQGDTYVIQYNFITYKVVDFVFPKGESLRLLSKYNTMNYA